MVVDGKVTPHWRTANVATSEWRAWYVASLPYLRRGDHLPVPRELSHPSTVGFSRPRLAEPRGQVADWVMSLDDGSRLHCHEYGNGVILAHRDAIDPARGPLAAAWHFIREARVGRALAVVGGVAAVAKIVMR